MSVFRGRTEWIVGALIAAALVFWWVASREDNKSDARDELVAEVQQWDRWSEVSELLMTTIDAHHEAIYDAHYDEKRGGRYRYGEFDEAGYRAQMYTQLRTALAEQGHNDAALELEQFRSRQRSRR